MKKAVLFLSLLSVSNFSFGQKKVEVSADEINVLGNVAYSPYRNKEFHQKEAEMLRLKDVIIYILEYQYEGKRINRSLLQTQRYIYSTHSSYRLDTYEVFPCFNMKDISNEIGFSLMKTNEWVMNSTQDGEFICKNDRGLKLFYSENIYEKNAKYRMADIADGKIRTKLYRLEEE